jgi:two-component system response regulator HydG
MTCRTPVLVIIDDEAGVLRLVGRFARSQGFEVQAYTSPREALNSLAHRPVDVAIVDLRMPEVGGLDVLRALREAHPECQVILMTGHASVETAIEAVKLGALDYVAKPLDFERLGQLLQTVRDDIARRVALLEAESDTARRLELCGMIGRSAVMQELFGLVRRIAPHARTALVTGETGTGKEGIARAIHELGPRRGRKFVTINCSAVVETLFESELFGHMRGAFTGADANKPGLLEVADGGTLLLDEVAELPLAVQAKLLRALELGEVQRVGSLQGKRVDVRIVAATNRDLSKEAESGRFRADLYYRLNVVELKVPALRDRLDDLPYLTAAFIREFSARFRKSIEGITSAAERQLAGRTWLGNVRELRNVLERACMLAEGPVLTDRDLTSLFPSEAAVTSPGRPSPNSLSDDVDRVERESILRALNQVRGNKRAAAERLGVSRRTLYRRLARMQP